MKILLEILENVFEPKKIFRSCFAKRFMSIEHFLFLLLFFLFDGAGVGLALKHFASWRLSTVRGDGEDLVKTKTGEQFPAACPAMNHAQVTLPKLLQPQGNARHGSHEGGV